jgi:plastocyanin
MTMYRALMAATTLFLAAQAWGATQVVHVGPSGLLKFQDEDSGTATTTIHPGDSVRWQWESDFHTVTRTTGPETFDTGTQMHDFTFTHTFPDAGTYGYICMNHDDLGMIGTIIVEPVGGSSTTTTTVAGSTTTSTTLPPGVSEKFDAANTALATLAADLGVTITGRSKKSFDKLLAKITTDLQDGQSLLAGGNAKKARTTLRRAVRSLITMRQRLGSKTGRKAVPDTTVRNRLITEAKDLKAKVQAALQSS